MTPAEKRDPVAFSDFVSEVHQGKVDQVNIKDREYTYKYKNADPAKGIREFVVGTGGRMLYPTGTLQPNSEKRITDVWGVLKLTLGDGSYTWDFVPAAGATASDSGTDTCH